MVGVFSTAKGMAGLAMALVHCGLNKPKVMPSVACPDKST
jgi:hypothetical protein